MRRLIVAGSGSSPDRSRVVLLALSLLLAAACEGRQGGAPVTLRREVGVSAAALPEDGQWTMAAKASWKYFTITLS